jgi:hypothetical protein
VNAEREPLSDLVEELDRVALIASIVDLEDAGTGAVVDRRELIEPLGNLAFQLKMLLILLAGLNLIAFYVTGIAHAADAVGTGGSASVAAKAIAATSLVLWFGVIFFGRLIMYNDTLLYALGL